MFALLAMGTSRSSPSLFIDHHHNPRSGKSQGLYVVGVG